MKIFESLIWKMFEYLIWKIFESLDQENVIHQVLLLFEHHLQSVHLHKYDDDSEWSGRADFAICRADFDKSE